MAADDYDDLGQDHGYDDEGDCCHHGIGFDEECEECTIEDEED